MVSYNLTGIHRPYFVLSTDNEEANGAEDPGVIKVLALVCEVDLYSCVVFADPSVLPITIDLVTFHIPDRNKYTYRASVFAIKFSELELTPDETGGRNK